MGLQVTKTGCGTSHRAVALWYKLCVLDAKMSSVGTGQEHQLLHDLHPTASDSCTPPASGTALVTQHQNAVVLAAVAVQSGTSSGSSSDAHRVHGDHWQQQQRQWQWCGQGRPAVTSHMGGGLEAEGPAAWGLTNLKEE